MSLKKGLEANIKINWEKVKLNILRALLKMKLRNQLKTYKQLNLTNLKHIQKKGLLKFKKIPIKFSENNWQRCLQIMDNNKKNKWYSYSNKNSNKSFCKEYLKWEYRMNLETIKIISLSGKPELNMAHL